MKSEALKETGRRHELREEWFQALEAYLRAVETRPEDEDPDISLHNRIGDLQVRVGDRMGAVASYVQAVDLYMEAGLPNNAIAVCRKIIRMDPALPESFLRMGQIRATQGLLVDARQNFLTYAEMKEAKGETGEALRAIEEFVGMAPGEVDTREFLAGQLLGRERQEDAVRYLSEAYRILMREDQAERAGEILVRLRELVPGMPAPGPDEVDGGAGLQDADLVVPQDLGGFESTALGVADDGPGEQRLVGAETGAGAGGDPNGLAAIDESELEASLEAGALEPPAGFTDVLGTEEIATLEEIDTGPDLDIEADLDAGPDLEIESDLDAGADLEIESALDAGPDLEIESAFDRESDRDRDSESHPGSLEVQGMDVWEESDLYSDSDEDVSELPYLELDAGESPVTEVGTQEEVKDSEVSAFSDLSGLPEILREDHPKVSGPKEGLAGSVEPDDRDQKIDSEDQVDSEDGYVDLGAWVLEGQKERTTRWTIQADAPTADEDADFRKTLARFREKVSEHIDTEDATAHYDLGMAYKEMGLLDEAIGEFQQALRTSPGSLATIEMLGQCFLDKGQPEIAIHTLERGARLEGEVEDDFIGVYYFLGHAYEAVGNAAAAREFYERVFALDINFRDVTDRLKRLR